MFAPVLWFVMLSEGLLWWCFHRSVLHFLYYFSFPLAPLSSCPHPFIISLHSTTEVNVERNLAAALLAIWCSVCVCVSLYFWQQTDSRLG